MMASSFGMPGWTATLGTMALTAPAIFAEGTGLGAAAAPAGDFSQPQ